MPRIQLLPVLGILFCLAIFLSDDHITASESKRSSGPPLEAVQQIEIIPLEPSHRGGEAFRLVYTVDATPEIFWKFKTDFKSDFLLTNRYITWNRFVEQIGSAVITETRYTGSPGKTFRWKTILYPSIRKMYYILLNPEECGQIFNYGFIKLEPVGERTRVTHTSYFDFYGASLWAFLPGSVGAEGFLKYTARWEQETISRLQPRYAVPGPP